MELERRNKNQLKKAHEKKKKKRKKKFYKEIKEEVVKIIESPYLSSFQLKI